MSLLHISDIELKEIKNIIKKLYPAAVVWAYGSRVNGNCHEGSDLDLVVIDFGVAKGNINQVREAFSESDIPILIDIRYWGDLPTSFQEEIKKSYIPILI
ncbi:MAG: nucleotidyltransferase domain-containing protein [Proteobacteria bacterium]|nr:nucleotidyltransferase domain-containing protein [Pseudomonadota bacterium]